MPSGTFEFGKDHKKSIYLDALKTFILIYGLHENKFHATQVDVLTVLRE